jgi:uncharacterized LabA/DUF88 family protein
MNNYAFIDTQNVHRGIILLGWKLDWDRFRIYLKEKYSVQTAYLFIGYIPVQQELYADLQRAGYIVIFKPVIFDGEGKAKGNCDADLVLYTLLEREKCDRAVIVSSDGDFYSLVRYLYQYKKLETVLSPYIKNCSVLLKKEAREKINFMDNLRRKIGKGIKK